MSKKVIWTSEEIALSGDFIGNEQFIKAEKVRELFKVLDAWVTKIDDAIPWGLLISHGVNTPFKKIKPSYPEIKKKYLGLTEGEKK